MTIKADTAARPGPDPFLVGPNPSCMDAQVGRSYSPWAKRSTFFRQPPNRMHQPHRVAEQKQPDCRDRDRKRPFGPFQKRI